MILKIFTLTELNILDLSEEIYQHGASYKHAGGWPKGRDSSWFAELTEYRSAKEQERIFITRQDNELQAKHLVRGMILERGYNRRDSGNYGRKLRTWYLIHALNDGKVYVSLHDTAKRAFTAKAKEMMTEAEFESAYHLQEREKHAEDNHSTLPADCHVPD